MSRRVILGFSIVALIVVAIMTFYVIDQRIPMSPTDQGNSAGNLHNGGLFFEMGNKVYFSNPYDDDCLYSMDIDEKNPKRMTSMGTKYISGANDMLYFYMDSTKQSAKVTGLGAASNQYGLYRCKSNGRNLTCLIRDFCGEVQLCGEYLYYQIKTEGGTLNKMRVDKTHKSKVADEMISPVCYANGVIYYTGVSSDHNIHAINTMAGDSTYEVLYGSMFYPVVSGSYLYYLDGRNDYAICRTNLVNGQTDTIVSDRVDNFTMNSQRIYYTYSNGLLSELRSCDLDGSNQITLLQGVTNSLNLTSRYLYFKVYGNDNLLYHYPLDGSRPPEVVTF